MNKKEIGLYIHIPFCAHKCDYCDFVSFSNKEDIIDKYINALLYAGHIIYKKLFGREVYE